MIQSCFPSYDSFTTRFISTNTWEPIKPFIQSYQTIVEAAKNNSQHVIDLILNRIQSEESKKSGISSISNGYKKILDQFLADLIVLYDNIEWPIVPDIVSFLCSNMVSLMRDEKKLDASIKSLLMGWLGKLCISLRQIKSTPVTNIPESVVLLYESEPVFTNLNDQNSSIYLSLQEKVLAFLQTLSIDQFYKNVYFN